MAVCVVPSTTGGPPTKYPIGSEPGAREHCVNFYGGTVVEDSTGCGSNSVAGSQLAGSGAWVAVLLAVAVGWLVRGRRSGDR